MTYHLDLLPYLHEVISICTKRILAISSLNKRVGIQFLDKIQVDKFISD